MLCKRIRRQVLLTRAGDTRVEVLVLSGSFNPVHTQHTALLEAVRTHLENNGSTVAGGFLLPSTDDYVSLKLGGDAMALRDRVRLCKLVSDPSDWLHVRPIGVMSSYWATRRLLRQIEQDCAAILAGRRVRGVEVMGSDTFRRIFGKIAEEATDSNSELTPYQERAVCCIIRPGSNSVSEKEKVGKLLPLAQRLRVDVTVVDSEDACVAALRDISSSSIRQLIRRRDWDRLREEGWLHPEVLSALRSDAEG
jgi:hypothetical protein